MSRILFNKYLNRFHQNIKTIYENFKSMSTLTSTTCVLKDVFVYVYSMLNLQCGKGLEGWISPLMTSNSAPSLEPLVHPTVK